jgi:hypothetical protein
MAILELPTLTTGEPHYVFRTQLEGVDYQFTMRFGDRRNCWVLDLDTLDGVSILAGQTVTIGRDLLNRARMPEAPPGTLWALNLIEPSEADGGVFALPGLYDLGQGGRARLYYTEAST